MILKKNYCEKYSPKTLNDLPLDYSLIKLINQFISIKRVHLLIISEDDYIKSLLVNALLTTLNTIKDDTLYVSKIKDQGVTNIRYEIKNFCQSPSKNGKKTLIIDDIHIFSESIQKLFVNNIDKWNRNINIIVTCNNIYNVDEILTTRLFPINIPEVNKEDLKNIVKNICQIEDIKLNEEYQELIVSLSEQNIQNIFHILEKCKLLQNDIVITSETIKKCCTLINHDTIIVYFNYLMKHKIYEGYTYLLKITENGHSVLDILNEIYNYIKYTNLLNEEQKYRSCKIVSSYIVVFITIHEEELELLLFTQELSELF